MLELVKETTNIKGNTQTFYDKNNKVFVKIHDWIDEGFYKIHSEIMQKYYPDILVDQSKDNETMQFTYKKIPGVGSKTVVNNTVMLTKLYKFLLKELERTWPYYHNDWSTTNILFNKGKFSLVDWTTIEKGASKAECISKINRDLREGFGEKLWASWIVTDEATRIMRDCSDV